MATDNLGFGNPFFEQQTQDSLGDMTRAFNLSVTPSIRSAMARAGSFGNSGLEQMAGEAERTLQASLGRQANDMRAGNYWQDQAFNKSIYDTTFGQQQQQFQNGMSLLGMQNGLATQNLGLANNIQNQPLNYWQQFGNQANAFGQGFGTSQSSTSLPGSPLMGAMGGWQLGSQFGKSMGGWGGTNYSGSAGGNPLFPEHGMASGATGAWT